MSIENVEKIKCPQCGKESEFTIWQSINTDLNPEMKEKVRTGEAFTFVCPECDTRTTIEYTCLYHQMSDRYMLYYAPQNVEEAVESFKDMKDSVKDFPELAEADSGYIYRVVGTKPEFFEKLAILDDGYDDKVMELLKLSLFVLLMEQNPELEIDRIFYIHEKEEPEFLIMMTDGSGATTAFVKAMYDELLQLAADKLKEDEEMVINFVWADKFFKLLNE